jgi:hypothetical protein
MSHILSSEECASGPVGESADCDDQFGDYLQLLAKKKLTIYHVLASSGRDI